MRFMIMVKEGENPPDRPPTSEEIAEMGKLNKEMADAGILLAMEGLMPSKFSTRVKYTGKQRRVVDGPFSETKELIGGFAIVEVPSLEEAVRISLDYGQAVDVEEMDIRGFADQP